MPLKIYQKEDAGMKYWTTFWKEREVSLENQQQYMEFNFLTRLIHEYLPNDGKIIEGGCGTGRWVFYLKEKGYKIIGIEWSKDVVEQVKAWDQNAPIEIGDIFNLYFPDGFFQAYISLGVIEHHHNWPMALKEAYRVLNNGGVLFCSVPFFNPVRRIKNIFGVYNIKEGEKFFEYRFTLDEIKQGIEKNGFKIIEVIPFSVPYGLTLEIPGIEKLHNFFGRRYKKEWHKGFAYTETKKQKVNSLFLSSFVQIIKKILETYYMRRIFGHMILIIAKK